MENGGNNNNNNNNKYWIGQTSNNNSNVWWDLVHLGLGGEEEEEEEMGISRPYDYWTSNNNVVMINSHDDHHHQHHQEEEKEEEVILMNPAINITNGIAKKQYHSSSLYAGSSHVYPDPHLTCLKLGNINNNNKRRQRQYYFEDATGNTTTTTAALGKKGKCRYNGDGVPLLSFGFGGGSSSSSSSSSTVVIPRCQVDGCHVELLCAREYHRRHKVCEVHSKAKKVEVLGIEQRFCQQCSRFHVITEFDDSKRSCRRRLAGHNERRRKMSSNSSSSSSNDSNTTTTTTIISTSRKCFDQGGGGGLPHPKIPSPPRVSNALSLLSTSGVSPAANLIPRKYNTDVALQDLIAENSANIMASQLFLNNQLARTLNTKNAS